MSKISASSSGADTPLFKLREALAVPAFRLDLTGLGLKAEHLALLDRLAM